MRQTVSASEDVDAEVPSALLPAADPSLYPSQGTDGMCVRWQLLMKDPSQRLELSQLLKHPWIVENADPTAL